MNTKVHNDYILAWIRNARPRQKLMPNPQRCDTVMSNTRLVLQALFGQRPKTGMLIPNFAVRMGLSEIQKVPPIAQNLQICGTWAITGNRTCRGRSAGEFLSEPGIKADTIDTLPSTVPQH